MTAAEGDSALVESQPALFQRYVALVADDDVIQQLDIEQCTGLADLAGYVDVFWGWGWVAGGMVMRDNHGRCVFFNGMAK